MRTPVDEREVHICFYTTDKVANVYTSDYRWMAKFDKLVEKSPDWKQVRQETCDGDIVSKSYECPVSFLTFRSKKVEPRPMTEEQRQIARERLAKFREQQKS